MTWYECLMILPELSLVLGACALLLVGVFWPGARGLLTVVMYLGLGLSLVSTFLSLGQGEQVGFFNHVVVDDLSQSLKLILLLGLGLIYLYSVAFLDRRALNGGEYWALALFSTLGCMVLLSGASFITLYLGLELTTLPLFALVAIRRTSLEGSEAAMKYFVLGALTSGLLLYGMSLLYGATGSFEIGSISNALSQQWLVSPYMVSLGILLVFVGIGFKFGLVPFHMWIPDVYQGAPTTVTLLLSSLPKIGAFGLAYRLLVNTLGELSGEWEQIWWALGILSVALGNLAALLQQDLRRLLGYSAIAHMGLLAFGFLTAPHVGYQNVIYFLLAYVLSVTAAFAILVVCKAGDVCCLRDVRGLAQQRPWLAALFSVVLLSLIGIPPTIGFQAKLAILYGLVQGEYLGVAVWTVVFTAIGAFYYLRIIKAMYFEVPEDSREPLGVSRTGLWVLSGHCGLMLVFGILPAPVLQWCSQFVQGAW